MAKHPLSFFLRPGVSLLRRLRFFSKMLLLLTILLIPIGTLTYFLHSEIQKVTDFASAERRGVQYLLPLNDLLISLSASSSSAPGSHLTDIITRLDEADRLFGSEMRTTQNWIELRPLLQRLSSASESSLHSEAINQTIEMIRLVGDNSNLILDPDTDTYYLADTIIAKLPNLVSKTSKLTLLKNNSAISPNDAQLTIAITKSELSSLLGDINNNITKATHFNPTLTKIKDPWENQSMFFQNYLVNFDSLSPSSQEISERLKIISSKNQEIMFLYLNTLDSLLDTRIQTALNHEKAFLSI